MRLVVDTVGELRRSKTNACLRSFSIKVVYQILNALIMFAAAAAAEQDHDMLTGI